MALTRINFGQINTTTREAEIVDPILLLNKNQTGNNTEDSGIIVERGDEVNVGLLWDESAESFVVITTTDTGSTAGDVSISSYAKFTAGDITANGNLVVDGNFTVNGTFTTLNVSNVDIEDVNITLAKNAVSASEANGAGITVAGANATITYNSADNEWEFNIPVQINGSLTAGNVTATNFYGDLSGQANTAVTVTGQNQPNITSVGNLASLTVTGNISANNATITNVAIADVVNANTVNVAVLANVTSTTAATSTTSGALKVAGGLGIGGNIYAGGLLSVTGNANTGNLSTTTAVATTGNITTVNAGTLNANTLVNVTASTASTSTTTGALRVSGGVGIGGNIYAGGLLNVTGNATTGNLSTGTLVASTANITTLTANTSITTELANIASTEASTNTTTGALRVAGGAGIAGNIYAGGQIVATGSITGNILYANTASFTGTGAVTLTTGNTSQRPGTPVEGMIRFNSETDVVEFYNGTTWANVGSGGGGTPGGSDTQIQYNNAGSFGGVSTMTFDGSLVTVSNLAISTIANVTSNTASTSTTSGALKVAGGVGIVGNIYAGGQATITGLLNAGNISTGGSVTATGDISGGNISGTSLYGNITSNGISDFSTIRVSTLANITASTASTSTTTGALVVAGGAGVAGNVYASAFYGSGTGLTSIPGANVTGTVANATYATSAGSATTAGTVTTNEQPNITSVGTLSSLTVTGNISAGNVSVATLTGNVTSNGTSNFSTLNANTLVNVTASTASTSTTTGALIVAGGVGVVGNIYAGGLLSVTGNATTGNLSTTAAVATTGNITTLNAGTINANTLVNVTATTASTSTTTGALKVAGGAGVAGNVYASAFYGAATGLTSIPGANVTGTVANATYATSAGSATTAGTVTTNAQPNITSLGTLTGLTLSGNLDMGNAYILNVPNPTSSGHAANKAYVDEIAEGLKAKPAVELATTGNLTATYNNGTNGTGATLTSTTNGAFPTIDGVTLTSTTPGLNGVLVKNQTNAAHNGRYNLTQVGDASNPWILTRCGICDNANEIPGSYVFVKDGTLYGGTGWTATVADPATFTVGTDAISWYQFSGAGTYTAGTGLTLTGTEFSVNANLSHVTNVGTLGTLSVTGNATTGNLSTTTAVISTLNGGTLNANTLVNVTATTAATSTTTGALKVAGGAGVAGNVYASAFYGAATGLTSIPGANVTGTVANATYATSAGTAGTVTTNAQPNITSVGTLSSLTVSGNIGAATANFTGNTAVTLTVGNTSQRPTPASGMIRFNSETIEFEGYNGSQWSPIGSGGGEFSLSGSCGTIYSSEAGGGGTGTNNFFVGYQAGFCNTSGVDNTFIGFCAGAKNTTGTDNIFVGGRAGASNTTGYNNNFLGYSAGTTNTTGHNNNFFGGYAGTCNTTGRYNTFFGYFAGWQNTTGINNTFIGNQAGLRNTTGRDNVFIGELAGACNISGRNNFFAGLCAGYSNVTGGYNTFIGREAGFCTVSGFHNTFIGCNAGCSVVSGSSNTIIGSIFGTSNLNNTVIVAAGTCERLKVDDSGLYINGNIFTGGSGGGFTYTVSATAPLTPSAGDQWYDSSDGTLYTYVDDGVTEAWLDFTAAITNVSEPALADTIVLRNSNGNVAASTFTGNLNGGTATITTLANITANTASTSTTTGALVVAGGAGIAGNIYVGGKVYGTATTAEYADLAEIYRSDAHYAPGTVVVFGGDQEITVSQQRADTRVAGVISTDPAFLMNDRAVGLPVALTGRVPCQVQGPVRKGTVLISSDVPGVAVAITDNDWSPGVVIGKSLEDHMEETVKTIEVVVGRF